MAEKVQALIEMASEEDAAAEALLEPPSPYSRSPLGARGTATQVHARLQPSLASSGSNRMRHAPCRPHLADQQALVIDSLLCLRRGRVLGPHRAMQRL